MKEPPSYSLLLSIFSDQGLFYILSIGGIAFLLLLSSIVSASEAAYFSFTSHHLDRFKANVDKRNNLIAELLGRPRLLLVSFIVLNTFVDVSIITISTSLVWEIASTLKSKVEVILLALFLCIVAIAVVGEIIPRIYGVKNNIRVAQRTVYAWRVWIQVLRPFSVFIIKTGQLLEKKMDKSGIQSGASALSHALELAAENTLESGGDTLFLRRLVNFGTLTVKEVMRPRHQISAIKTEMNFQELINYISKTGFARIPVYRKSIDNIVGVLYPKDLLPFIEEKHYPWQNLIRPGFFVNESMRISSLLKDFQEKHVHMAIALNVSLNTVGLITLEDIVQEIMGNVKEHEIK
ncbi:CNNM domain-containing protein [Chryseolinea sp. H1M3-3]|uniref:CNNM domain-containing protein n=1 Tax=Chryseolinea sp. H1M3-3 TaxID=3034144 RepID=UPI0023ED708A|nr:CNNM domain-containing protein [Chryseolinea sp. H1M3-3]